MMVKTTVTMTMPMPKTTNDSSDDARLRRLYRHARTLHCTTHKQHCENGSERGRREKNYTADISPLEAITLKLPRSSEKNTQQQQQRGMARVNERAPTSKQRMCTMQKHTQVKG